MGLVGEPLLERGHLHLECFGRLLGTIGKPAYETVAAAGKSRLDRPDALIDTLDEPVCVLGHPCIESELPSSMALCMRQTWCSRVLGEVGRVLTEPLVELSAAAKHGILDACRRLESSPSRVALHADGRDSLGRHVREAGVEVLHPMDQVLEGLSGTLARARATPRPGSREDPG